MWTTRGRFSSRSWGVHPIKLSSGARRTEVAAQGDQHGREAAPVDEVAFHRAPLALRWRRWTRPKGGAAGALLHLGEEGQRVRHGTSEPMDRQVDGSGAPLPAQMVVEHEAVDADDRFGMPPACVVFGVAAVAEGAEDIFEGVASQPLRPRAAIPWVEMPHGYAGSGVPRSFGPPLPDCRRRRRSALRCFWRSGRPVRASLASRPVPAFPVIRRVGPRVARFEACSTFTRVAAHMGAKPPRAARCTGVLQSKSLPPLTAPIATGWSDSCRAGFTPAG